VRLLAIESATDMVGVALIGDDGASAERSHVGGRAHAELLVPAIEEVCAVSGCELGDLDHIAVDIGPGLFTGLRVGVATAKALAQALGIGLLGVSSLDVLAGAAAERQVGGERTTVVSVVDARRGEVFAAAYRYRTTGTEPADPASVRQDRLEPMSPPALQEWVRELSKEGPVTVVGDGALRYVDLLGPTPGVDLDWAESLAAPPPLVLARLAVSRLAAGVETVSATDLVPDYRRAADAKINWEQRAPARPAKP
jgi:tRNA threonylcarbamoyladenosine biosynthesis protein TsaB